MADFLKDLLGADYREGMTFEEISSALEKANKGKQTAADNSTHLKELLSRANSEAADWKKKYTATLSEQERLKAEQEEQFNNMKTELEAMKREKAVSENYAKLVSIGYDEDLAQATANAMLEGDFNTIFTNQKAFMEKKEKEIKLDLLKGTPRPAGGSVTKTKTMTQADLYKMSTRERVQFISNHRKEYEDLSNGKTIELEE